MKKILIILTAVLSSSLMVSCNKELSMYDGDDIAVITAIIEDDTTRTSLSGSDTEGYDVVWTKGDSFKIGQATFTLSEGAGTRIGKFTCSATQLKKLQNGTFTVYYPSAYNGTWPAAQNYNEAGLFTNYPMKASVTVSNLQVPESISFKNEGGILRLTVDATEQPEPVIVNSVTVSATELDESISLYSGDGVTIDEDAAKDFYIAIPAGEYTGTTITFNTLDGKVFKKSLKAGKSLVVERSAITTAKFSVKDYTEPFPDGVLPGVFSISDTKKVVFSRGNLYWNGGSFQFEGSQLMYDDQWNESHVSHFFWTPEADNAYAGEFDFDADMLPEDKFFTTAEGFTANGESDTWFSLSNEEWEYLLGESGADSRDGKCSYATVAGRKGYVIAPDNYTGTLKEKYDAAEWPSSEKAGLVFLPFAGQRMDAENMGDFETQGCYWASTVNEEDESCADYWGFIPDGILSDNTWRESGYAVRLVKEYSAPAPATTGKAKATINSVETDVNWIQLWKDGPKFAEYNVSGKKKFSVATKTGADYVWGANWKTPSKDELNELLLAASETGSEKVSCIYGQVNGEFGFTFRGVGDYAGNSVFFPLNSDADCDETFGYVDYWTSTPDGSKCFTLWLQYDWIGLCSEWGSGSSTVTKLIRPVLNE